MTTAFPLRSREQNSFEMTLIRLAVEQAQVRAERRPSFNAGCNCALIDWIAVNPLRLNHEAHIADHAGLLREMQAAVAMLEAAISDPSISTGDMKRLHRQVAMRVHPDLHDLAYREIAEEHMKRANALIGVVLQSRADRTPIKHSSGD